MTVPWDTDTYYELAVSTTVVGGVPQLKLCRVVINYEGLNIPCHVTGEQLLISTTSDVDSYDKIVWDLGRIRNSALRFTRHGTIATTAKAPSTPATISKQQATLSKQRSTLSKQHSTLLQQAATMSNDSIIKFRPFDSVEKN